MFRIKALATWELFLFFFLKCTSVLALRNAVANTSMNVIIAFLVHILARTSSFTSRRVLLWDPWKTFYLLVIPKKSCSRDTANLFSDCDGFKTRLTPLQCDSPSLTTPCFADSVPGVRKWQKWHCTIWTAKTEKATQLPPGSLPPSLTCIFLKQHSRANPMCK